ncbi:MAG: glucose-1-phosphate cytidylyltransferase [bacterium]
MKVVILAGGLGTRLAEETETRPKPMVEIGGKPILWHIMKIYSHYGFNEFIICLGYKGYMVREYFANYFLYQSDVTIDLSDNSMEVHSCKAEPWKITLVDTGLNTQTGGRIKKVKDYIGKSPFMFTYGDGVADVDISKLVKFHKKNKKLITMTAVQPEGRYGSLDIDKERGNILKFLEKPKGDNAWVNGGFFVAEPQVLDYIKGDGTTFEKEPLEKLAKNGQLMAFKHKGIWKCMDTMRDKSQLNQMWDTGNAAWKVWDGE